MPATHDPDAPEPEPFTAGIELRHLRYLLAVAATGSVTTAAERLLHTSQPSLSRQLRDLEARVGAALLARSARGVTLTDAGRAFVRHARLALQQVDAAVEAARRAAEPAKERLAIGFLTGQEMRWLPQALRLLRAELPAIDVTVSSDYSPELADAVARGRLDAAFLRAEPGHGLAYRPIDGEPLVVLMPAGHRLAFRQAVRASDLRGQPFIAMDARAGVLRGIVDAYLRRSRVVVDIRQRVDNPAMVMSMIAATGALTLIPAYLQDLMPPSVVGRPLAGAAPTIDLVVGYRQDNRSPALALLLSRVAELAASSRRTR